jgi:hypothetical protein
MADKVFKLGQSVVVVGHERHRHPFAGRIVAITTEPGKTIGVAATEEVGGNSLDGRCKQGHGLWVSPHQVRTPEAFHAELERRKAEAGREKESITHKEVGQVKVVDVDGKPTFVFE